MMGRMSALSAAVSVLIPNLVWAQAADPIWVKPVEPDSRCPAVTLQDCSDPDWLYSDDPCAIEQNAPTSDCAGLLYFDMDDRSTNGDEEIFVVSKNLEPEGVKSLIRSAPATRSPEPAYTPDLYSITSQKGGVDYSGAGEIAANIYLFWENNGTQVDSCREYVYERYYDVNEFQRRIKGKRDDYKKLFDDAYGPGYNKWAIGTRHLNSDSLRGKDGKIFGKIFTHTTKAKNEFFAMRNHPNVPGQRALLTGPGLLTSLSKYDSVTAARLQKIQNFKTNLMHMVAKSWYWNKTTEAALTYDPDSPGGGLALNQQLLYAPNNNNDDAIVDQLGTVANNPNLRRRLYEELDELYDLQQRLKGLQEDWARADQQFKGTGWNVTDAGLEDNNSNIAQFVVNYQGGGGGLNLNYQSNGYQLGPVQQAQNLAPPDLETPIRQRILDEMVEVLAKADEEGCLEGGLTSCDWSPRGFAEELLFDFGEEEDALYTWCQDFTGGNLQNVLNLNIEVVPPGPYHCVIQTGAHLTAAGLEQLQEQVEVCREAEVQYKTWVAEQEAKARVQAIPELYDESTGQLKPPGFDKSRDEYMGNKYFGLGYDYAFGFGMDIQPEICTINMHAGGHLNAYVNLLTLPVSLIDAAAYGDTEAREVDVHASVLGIELFEGIHRTWSTQEDFHFDLVKTPKKSKDQTLIDTKIIVVVVPIGIKLGISGEVGANLGLTLDTEGLGGDACPAVEIAGLVEPFIGMGGYVSAAIDIFIAAAGVRGEVNIITVSLPFKPGVRLAILGGMGNNPLPSGLELQLKASLDLKLSTLSGRIFAFAEIGFCPFCYTGEFTIVEWTGPHWNTKIIDSVYTINLADLDAAFN